MTTLFSPDELIDMVDTLATIRADIADLKSREETYKAALIAAGHRAIDGTQHRATISEPVYRVTIDWRTIAERLEPSRQLIKAHTTTAEEPTITVRISGRKTV
jgi:hypothetical protein